MAWGLYASDGNLATAVRPLDSTLQTDDTLRFSIDSGYVDTGGVVGMNLQNSAGEDLLQLRFGAGDTNWTVTDAAGDNAVPQGFSSDGFDIEITLTSASEYSLSMALVGNVPVTFTGTFANPSGGQTIDQIRFYNFNAGSGSERDLFFNKLEVERPGADVENWEMFQ